MKRFIISTLFTAAIALAMTLPASAQEKKKKADPDAPRTISGAGLCAKCELGETEKCQNAIQVKRKGKDGKEATVTYYLADNDVSKQFHKNLCKGTKEVTAVGTVKREGGKQTLTASKIELKQ